MRLGLMPGERRAAHVHGDFDEAVRSDCKALSLATVLVDVEKHFCADVLVVLGV